MSTRDYMCDECFDLWGRKVSSKLFGVAPFLFRLRYVYGFITEVYSELGYARGRTDGHDWIKSRTAEIKYAETAGLNISVRGYFLR